MTTILAKNEEDMKKGRSKSISMVTTQGSGVQKRKYPTIQLPMRRSMSRSKNVPSTSNAPKSEGFKGKCNYCNKIGHKKTVEGCLGKER